MGSSSRRMPARLAEKLLQIRLALDLSQEGMVDWIGLEEIPRRSYISGYELGTREPTLTVLLRISRLIQTPLEYLVDDELDLVLTPSIRAAAKRTGGASVPSAKGQKGKRKKGKKGYFR